MSSPLPLPLPLPAPAAVARGRELTRPRSGRLLAGVAAGLAEHLRLPVHLVRVALAGSVVIGGFGLVLYVWLWAFTPQAAGQADDDGPAAPSRQWPARFSSAGSIEVLIGSLLLAGGLALLGWMAGLPISPAVVIPVLVVVAGAILAFRQLDEVDRSSAGADGRPGPRSRRAAALPLVAGCALVVTGVLVLAVRQVDPAQLVRTIVAALAVLAGAALVLGPWVVRTWRNLDAERAARARDAERADIAAHLHDSVLQTLALIQRRSTDPGEVIRLARAQERDLRRWLYDAGPNDPSTLAARVQQVAAEVEDTHGGTFEVITVGDRSVDARVSALLGALREAMTNAARHAGGTVGVYVESGPDGVEAFVRDRGPGFELADIPADRLGVRESVLGRMDRAGGSAVVISSPGEGAEIRLRLPHVGMRQEGAS